jgi:hypothetical protein
MNANSWNWLPSEAKDGNLDNWESRSANDKWNFNPDDDLNQNCFYFKDTFFKLNADKTSMAPSFTWSKMVKPKDTVTDVRMKWNDSLPVYWQFKFVDVEKKGFFNGLFLDDPRNPTLSKAIMIITGVASSAALVAANLY